MLNVSPIGRNCSREERDEFEKYDKLIIWLETIHKPSSPAQPPFVCHGSGCLCCAITEQQRLINFVMPHILINVLFRNANLTIERGEKIAIVGPNGCGNSTLLKLIMGLEKPCSGEVLLGEHNVLPNYFEQNQAEALDLNKTVLKTVAEVAEDWRLDDIKELLGRCNFKADMLDRKVSFLSGGEKFMVKPSTLLVLDEPPNHFDIPSKEMLEEAVNEYESTVITVSHDGYFIKQIVDRVLEVKDGTLQDCAGDYNVLLQGQRLLRVSTSAPLQKNSHFANTETLHPTWACQLVQCIQHGLSEAPFRPREVLFEKQKLFQSIHKHTFSSGKLLELLDLSIHYSMSRY